MNTNTIPTADQARAMTSCPACDQRKDQGCLVCWTCFKYRTDLTPLKYAYGTSTFQDWVRTARSVGGLDYPFCAVCKRTFKPEFNGQTACAQCGAERAQSIEDQDNNGRPMLYGGDMADVF